MPARSVHQFAQLIYHPVFLSAFFSWFIAQMLKAVISLITKRYRSSRDLVTTFVWATGGMPSSHSCMVTALATSIGFTEGINSPLFIAMLCYGLLTIRDALGVRRAAGTQARVINYLSSELESRLQIPRHPVKEVHGHTMAEVSVGVILGFFIAVAFSNL
ncbi:MAG TPA: divergent PAP2 family protein [Spirochaetia bacterium]|nr:divergent PAP2 family protein [Spirochaetia bacterium]